MHHMDDELKRIEKKQDGNCTRMLRAILNKSWKQHPTKQQLYGHLPPITKTIQIRRKIHEGHCRRNKNEVISDVLLWTHSLGRASIGWPTRTYLKQLCADTECSLEDLPKAMDDGDKWRERGSGKWMFTVWLYDNDTLIKGRIYFDKK